MNNHNLFFRFTASGIVGAMNICRDMDLCHEQIKLKKTPKGYDLLVSYVDVLNYVHAYDSSNEDNPYSVFMNIARQQSYFPDLLCVETQDLKALLDIKSMYATVIPNYKQTELNVLSRLGFKHHVDLLKNGYKISQLAKDTQSFNQTIKFALNCSCYVLVNSSNEIVIDEGVYATGHSVVLIDKRKYESWDIDCFLFATSSTQCVGVS